MPIVKPQKRNINLAYPQNVRMPQTIQDLHTANSTFVETNMPGDLTLKFSDDYFQIFGDNISNMAPGWLEPSTDDFFTRIIDEPILIKEGRVQKMTAQAADIDQFEVKAFFDAERNPADHATAPRQSHGLTENETTPDFTRKRLFAVNMNFMTWIKKSFLLGNIKKESFLQWYTAHIGNLTGVALMNFGMYARHDTPYIPVKGAGTAWKETDGILKQALDIYNDDARKGNGFAELGYRNNIADTIDKAILQYADDHGASKNAKLILPSNVRMRLAIELKNKDTDFADNVYLRGPGEVSTVYGKPLLDNELLEDVYNGWGNNIHFKDGFPVPSDTEGSTKAINVVYGYFGDPQNIVWGMLKEAEIQSSFEHRELAYLVSANLAADVKINYDQDTLIIPFELGYDVPDSSS